MEMQSRLQEEPEQRTGNPEGLRGYSSLFVIHDSPCKPVLFLFLDIPTFFAKLFSEANTEGG